MNKTVSITIGGSIFHIEEDAFAKLKKYLDAVKKHFSDYDDIDEIIADIEASVAEKFADKIKRGKKQAINLVDVESMIKTMGTVEDIAETTEDEIKAPEPKDEPAKRLYRNPDDQIIAGVCSGIASYFGIDPIIIRLFFVITIFFGGTGMLAYIILWIVMPEAKTPTEKLEMKGSSVTLKKIEKNIKDTVKKTNINQSDLKKASNKILNFIKEIAQGVLKFFQKIIPVISAIIGIFFALAGFASIFAISFAGAIAATNYNSSYINEAIPVADIFSYAGYLSAIMAAYFVVLIPLIYIFLTGLSMMKRKSVFGATLNTILISVWMIAIIAIGTIGIKIAPDLEKGIDKLDAITGVSNAREYEYDDFSKIASEGNFEFNIKQGPRYEVRIEAKESDLEKIKVIKNGDTLTVKRPPGFYLNFLNFMNYQPATVNITIPELKSGDFSGASKLYLIDYVGDDLNIELSGASSGKIEAKLSGSLTIKLSGASTASAYGQAEAITTNISGASNIKAFGFETQNADLELSGASDAQVTVTESLSVEASGASSVDYKGGANITKQILSGASDISKVK